MWIGAAVLVVILGLGLGYYISGPSGEEAGGPKPGDTGPASTSSTSPVASTSSTSAAPVRIGEFTAKGAPKIQIEEQDPNAVPKASNTNATSATGSMADLTGATSSTASSTSPSAPETTPGNDTNAVSTSVPSEPAAPQPRAEKSGSATASGSGQMSQPAQAPSTDQSAGSDASPLYHVLVGTTFTTEKSARSFAADLRHRGFMAMTSPVTGDTGTVYKVQVGAYRSRLAAEQAAGQLQQSGYPAYIATDR